MEKKLMKKIVVLAMAIFTLTSVFAFSLPAIAADAPDLWGNTNIQEVTGLGNKDPRAIAASVINVMLGFLGIIAVIIILLGGFKWMTAGGNEDKVGEAKKLIMAGIIGLIIILAAYAIASFVLTQLITATTGT